MSRRFLHYLWFLLSKLVAWECQDFQRASDLLFEITQFLVMIMSVSAIRCNIHHQSHLKNMYMPSAQHAIFKNPTRLLILHSANDQTSEHRNNTESLVYYDDGMLVGVGPGWLMASASGKRCTQDFCIVDHLQNPRACASMCPYCRSST